MNSIRPILLLLLLALALPKSAANAYKVFRDSTNTYTVSYPADWQPKVIEGAQFWRSAMEDKYDIFRENVNLMLQDMPTPPLTLKGYTDLSREQINTMGGVGKVISERKVELKGLEAIEMVCDFTFDASATKVKNTIFLRGSHIYLFTYTGLPENFNQYEAAATRLMWNFRFEK